MENKDEVRTKSEEIEKKVTEFNSEFMHLQERFGLRVIAQIVFPGGGVLTVPLQVMPMQPPTVAAPHAETPLKAA